MEDKENLVDWIDNQFVEHAKRLGLKLQMIDNPKNSNQENASVFGTITFLKGDSAKKAAAIMASSRGKTIRDYEGILLHIPHSSSSFPVDSKLNSFCSLVGLIFPEFIITFVLKEFFVCFPISFFFYTFVNKNR